MSQFCQRYQSWFWWGWVVMLLGACQTQNTPVDGVTSPPAEVRRTWISQAEHFHEIARYDSAQWYWQAVRNSYSPTPSTTDEWQEAAIEIAYQEALQGQTASALTRLYRLQDQIASPGLRAKHALYLGHTYGLIGQQQKAFTLLQESLTLWGQVPQADSQLLGLNHFLIQGMAHLLSKPDLRDAHLDTCQLIWQRVLPEGHYQLADAQLAAGRRQLVHVPADTFAYMLRPAGEMYAQQASPRRELGLAQISLLQGINQFNRYETPRAAKAVYRALDLLYAVNPRPVIPLARAHQIMASIQGRQAEPDTALFHLEQAARWHQNFLPDSLPSYHRLDQYRTAREVHFAQNAYHQSIEAAQAEIRERKLLLGGKLNVAQAQAYSRLGTSYNYLGNPGKALRFQEESMRIYDQLDLPISVSEGISRYHLASSYSSVEMEAEAAKEFKSFLEIAGQFFPPDFSGAIQSRALLAATLARLGKMEEARQHAEVAASWVEDVLQTDNEDHLRAAITILGNLNRYYVHQGKFEQALEQIRTEIRLKRQLFGQQSPSLLPAYRDAIQRLGGLEEYETVITTIDTFAHLCGYTFPLRAHPFPGLELPAIQLELFAVLLVQGMIYQEWMHLESEDAELHSRRFSETMQELYSLLEIMLEGKELQQEQANLIKDIWPVLAQHVAELVQLSQDRSDRADLNLAFNIAEISKAIWLRQALSDPFYALEDRLPSEVKDARDQNQERLKGTYQRMMRLEVGNDPRQDSLRQALASQEVQLLQEADSITALIHDMFADYPASNAAAHLFSPKDIQQKLLEPESLLLEFVWGKKNITVVEMTRDSFSGYVIPLDSSFRALLQSYRSLTQDSLGVIGRVSRDKQLDSVMAAYCEAGYALYQQLLAPALTRFPEARQLVVIPDGPLSYMPFDALLTRKVHPKEARYGSLPYLIKAYAIQYEYAAGLLARNRKALPGEGLLAMAPAFGKELSLAQMTSHAEDTTRLRRSFRDHGVKVAPLYYNIPEAEGIHTQLKGRLLTGDAASKTSFLQAAPQYRILHLATHAFASEEDPDYSHLVFASEEDTSAYDFLYAYELYGLKLQADLAVLSACQTGFGRIERGEGIMSLSRAFKYAGCPNIVTSLWQAEDYSTQLLMKRFYTHLKAGMGKAAALRQAKLDFLDQAPAGNHHPFFWGTFVLIGDNEPVSFPTAMWKWLALGALLVLGGIGIWVWKARESP